MNPFAYFDRSHQENFCASVLLFVLDLDPTAFGETLVSQFTEAAGLGTGWSCRYAQREVGLVPDEHGGRDRTDLVFELERGSSTATLLVEVKTHTGWVSKSVSRQLVRQASGRPLRDGRHPSAVLLLAPHRLIAEVDEMGLGGSHAVSWTTLLSALSAASERSGHRQLVQAAIEHLARTTNVSAGLDGTTSASVSGIIQGAGVLEGLLDRCLRDLGGSDPQKLHLPKNGEASTLTPWTWRAMQRKFKREGKTYWIGVYDYLPGSQGEGLRLDLYEDSGDFVVGIEIPRDHPLSMEGIEQLRTAFAKAAGERLSNPTSE